MIVSKKSLYSAKEILTLCVAVDAHQGFRYIKSREKEEGEEANFHILLECLRGNRNIDITDEHAEKADEIIDYFQGLIFKAIQRPLSDFEQKIVDLIKAEDININGRDDRLVVAPSLPNMHRNNIKHDVWSDKERSLRSTADFEGELRKRSHFEGTIEMSRYIARSHSVLIAVLTENENIVKCFLDMTRFHKNTVEDFAVGQKISFSGYVKSHEVSQYSRCKETFVNRVTFD
jgi:type VI protein secretion system component Hcp